MESQYVRQRSFLVSWVTEPSYFGITLPKKTPFIYSIIGGAVGERFINGQWCNLARHDGRTCIFGIFNFHHTGWRCEEWAWWTSLIAIRHLCSDWFLV